MTGLVRLVVLLIAAYGGAYFYFAGVAATGQIRRTPQVPAPLIALLSAQDREIATAIGDGEDEVRSLVLSTESLRRTHASFARMSDVLGPNGPALTNASALMTATGERLIELQRSINAEARALREINQAFGSGASRDEIIAMIDAMSALRSQRAGILDRADDDLRLATVGLQFDRDALQGFAGEAAQYLVGAASEHRRTLERLRGQDQMLGALEARYRDVADRLPVFYRLENPVWM